MRSSLLPLALLVFVPAVVADEVDPEPPGRIITTRGGLKYEELKTGKGDAAKGGDWLKVHYTGWLSDKGKKGKKFDSTEENGKPPFTFTLGNGQVIQGFDQGFSGMKPGG